MIRQCFSSNVNGYRSFGFSFVIEVEPKLLLEHISVARQSAVPPHYDYYVLS
jgi:hypothetical protein